MIRSGNVSYVVGDDPACWGDAEHVTGDGELVGSRREFFRSYLMERLAWITQEHGFRSSVVIVSPALLDDVETPRPAISVVLSADDLIIVNTKGSAFDQSLDVMLLLYCSGPAGPMGDAKALLEHDAFIQDVQRVISTFVSSEIMTENKFMVDRDKFGKNKPFRTIGDVDFSDGKSMASVSFGVVLWNQDPLH